MEGWGHIMYEIHEASKKILKRDLSIKDKYQV